MTAFWRWVNAVPWRWRTAHALIAGLLALGSVGFALGVYAGQEIAQGRRDGLRLRNLYDFLAAGVGAGLVWWVR